MTRFALFLDVLSEKDQNLSEWADWVRSVSPGLAIASIRAGALGSDLQAAAQCQTAQERAGWCSRALEAKSLEYGFDLAKFTQPETERVCRYLELLAHSAA
jgi:hypothetical protein